MVCATASARRAVVSADDDDTLAQDEQRWSSVAGTTLSSFARGTSECPAPHCRRARSASRCVARLPCRRRPAGAAPDLVRELLGAVAGVDLDADRVTDQEDLVAGRHLDLARNHRRRRSGLGHLRQRQGRRGGDDPASSRRLKGMKDLMSRTSRGLVRVRAFRRWTPRRGQSGHRRTRPACGTPLTIRAGPRLRPVPAL